MNKQTLVIISPYNTRSGYGQHSRLIIRSLLNNPKFTERYDISLMSLRWGGTPLNALDPNNLDDRKLLDKNLSGNQLNFQPDVSIHITIPSEFQRIGKFSIGITAGTEATLAPPKFIEGCNQIDLIITPSEFTKQVLIGTKVDKKDGDRIVETLEINKPIESLFEGLDTELFSKNNLFKSNLTEQINSIKESFCFLYVGHWLQGNLGQDRKDVGMLVKTFLDTFKKKSPKNRPALILKTSGAGFSITERDQILNKIHQIQDLIKEAGFNGELPQVYLINGDLTDKEMNELYNHPKVKAMISFTKGEGFGLPLLEFTSTGKPVICSGYSGPMDFLNPDYSVLLPGKLTKIDGSAANEWLPKEAEWFTVNYTFASQILNDVAEKYDKYLERSRKSVKFTKDNFSLEKMSEKLEEILNKYIQEQPKKLSIKLPQLKKV